MDSFSGHLGVIWGHFGGHFGISLGSFRDHFGIIFWDDFGIIRAVIFDRFCMIFRIFLCDFSLKENSPKILVIKLFILELSELYLFFLSWLIILFLNIEFDIFNILFESVEKIISFVKKYDFSWARRKNVQSYRVFGGQPGAVLGLSWRPLGP